MSPKIKIKFGDEESIKFLKLSNWLYGLEAVIENEGEPECGCSCRCCQENEDRINTEECPHCNKEAERLFQRIANDAFDPNPQVKCTNCGEICAYPDSFEDLRHQQERLYDPSSIS